MTLLKEQTTLTNQAKEFESFLQVSEGFKRGTAAFFAKQIQDFVQSELTPKAYFEAINPNDERAGETFLMNFRHFVQFQQNQYFEDFHELRWELVRKHVRGVFLIW
ncbi:hypothetical protein J7E81_02985 [Bacillus sp. ISL-18]|uniref:hypothetical protein n=1 Tax=Bacillus sp. ISL-18 TaxID=2819118 RepID=UPI001BE93F4F|nr:hypothetical protein [Bacillus sp. ISL-18]MBT2654209.1 hypothetical protein [Bacillus sp. ISL-18]